MEAYIRCSSFCFYFFFYPQLGKGRVEVIDSDCYMGILVPDVKISLGRLCISLIIYVILSIKVHSIEEKQRSLAFAQTHQQILPRHIHAFQQESSRHLDYTDPSTKQHIELKGNFYSLFSLLFKWLYHQKESLSAAHRNQQHIDVYFSFVFFFLIRSVCYFKLFTR